MSIEVQQLIEIITKVQASQDAANARFDEHLTRLRESMHEIKNDYHGVAALSKVTHEKIKETNDKVDRDTLGINNRIDKTNVEIKLIKDELADFKPVVNSVKIISGNVTKVLTGLVISAIVWVVVQMKFTGG